MIADQCSKIYTKEELKKIITNFRSHWITERYIFNDNKELSVNDEFYHGACHFFSTALAVILGIENTKIYNLYGMNEDGTRELIHSIVDYLPLRTSIKPSNRALHFRIDNDSCYDIQSFDGEAWNQAEYVFINDDNDGNCPFLKPEWNANSVWWEIEPTENIHKMLDSYENGLASQDEVNYWSAIYSCLMNSVDMTEQKHYNHSHKVRVSKIGHRIN